MISNIESKMTYSCGRGLSLVTVVGLPADGQMLIIASFWYCPHIQIRNLPGSKWTGNSRWRWPWNQTLCIYKTGGWRHLDSQFHIYPNKYKVVVFLSLNKFEERMNWQNICETTKGIFCCILTGCRRTSCVSKSPPRRISSDGLYLFSDLLRARKWKAFYTI